MTYQLCRQSFITILPLAILFGAANVCFATVDATLTSATGSRVESQVQTAQDDLKKEDEKQRQVLSALYELNKKIKKSVLERGALLREQAQLETSIQDLQADIEEGDQTLVIQKALLAERLRAIYKFGGPSVARLLFGSVNATTLDRNLRILGVIAKQDRETIKNYIYDLKLLKTRKAKLDGRLASLKEIQNKIILKEAKLVAEQKTKAKLLEGIRKSKAFAISRLQDLKRQLQDMQVEDTSVLDALYKPSFSELKGQIQTPVSGKLVRSYGLIQGPGRDKKTSRNTWSLAHKGVLFEVPFGETVKNVFDGVVVYSEFIPGMGKTMIVDHGDHYYTVYSGYSEALVKEGDEVKQAQTLARLQNSERKNELYFEIRHFSETYDPKDWMKGLSL